MNQKDYGEIQKHLMLEKEMEEQEALVDAFIRVEKGDKFSIHDLELVNKTIQEQSKSSGKKVFNMREVINVMDSEVTIGKNNISKSKSKLKKRGVDSERLRRQRRLQQERQRRLKLEKSQERSRFSDRQ